MHTMQDEDVTVLAGLLMVLNGTNCTKSGNNPKTEGGHIHLN